jgi:hypothetical protein
MFHDGQAINCIILASDIKCHLFCLLREQEIKALNKTRESYYTFYIKVF